MSLPAIIPEPAAVSLREAATNAKAAAEWILQTLEADGEVPWLKPVPGMSGSVAARCMAADMARVFHAAELDCRRAWRTLNQATRGKETPR